MERGVGSLEIVCRSFPGGWVFGQRRSYLVQSCSGRCRRGVALIPSKQIPNIIGITRNSSLFQVRLYSRDLDLAAQNVLHRETFTAPVVLLSLVDNSLLVYTADNTLFHFLILPTQETVTLHLCGSISFDGVVAVPSAVRSMSWMVPPAQKSTIATLDTLGLYSSDFSLRTR